MKKRRIVLLVLAVIILSMLSLNASEVNTIKIFVDPASDIEGVIWDVVTCDHEFPENIRNDGDLQIGWGKEGDIINLVEEIDFGNGLVSLTIMITYADTVPEEASIVVRAGDIIIAEVVPVATSSWRDPQEITAELKEPITGRHEVTLEWVNNRCGLGPITFEVIPDLTATAVVTASPTVAPTATKNAPTVAPTVAATEQPKDSNTGTIIGLVAVIVVSCGVVAILLIAKKKRKSNLYML